MLNLAQCLPCAGQRIALGVNKPLDLKYQFYISPTIQPLSSPALVRLKLRKLGLPKPQNIGLKGAYLRYVSNFEVETVGDDRLVSVTLLRKIRGHEEVEWALRSSEKLTLPKSIGPSLHHL
jgi:hypothetical protein